MGRKTGNEDWNVIFSTFNNDRGLYLISRAYPPSAGLLKSYSSTSHSKARVCVCVLRTIYVSHCCTAALRSRAVRSLRKRCRRRREWKTETSNGRGRRGYLYGGAGDKTTRKIHFTCPRRLAVVQNDRNDVTPWWAIRVYTVVNFHHVLNRVLIHSSGPSSSSDCFHYTPPFL